MVEATYPATPRPAGSRRCAAGKNRLVARTAAVILMIAFILAPLAAVVFLGFTDFELGYGSFRFVGFENYGELFFDRTFRQSLWNTAIYSAIVAPVSLFLGLGHRAFDRKRKDRSVLLPHRLFLPVASLLVAMATVWQYLFHPTSDRSTPPCNWSGSPARIGSAHRAPCSTAWRSSVSGRVPASTWSSFWRA